MPCAEDPFKKLSLDEQVAELEGELGQLSLGLDTDDKDWSREEAGTRVHDEVTPFLPSWNAVEASPEQVQQDAALMKALLKRARSLEDHYEREQEVAAGTALIGRCMVMLNNLCRVFGCSLEAKEGAWDINRAQQVEQSELAESLHLRWKFIGNVLDEMLSSIQRKHS